MFIMCSSYVHHVLSCFFMSYPMVVACGCSFEKAEDCNGKQESNPSLMLVIGDFEGNAL